MLTHEGIENNVDKAVNIPYSYIHQGETETPQTESFIMNKLIRTAVLGLAIVISGVGLTACGETNPNAGYNGTAIIVDHKISAKRCRLVVEFPDGNKHTYSISGKATRYSKCRSVVDGGNVVFKNGKVKDYDKK